MRSNETRRIHIAGFLLACLYGIISVLSLQFLPSVETLERPLLIVIGLFGAASAIYAWTCMRVIGWPMIGWPMIGWPLIDWPGQSPSNDELAKPNVWRAIVIWAIVFRAIMIGSLPIQEVDLYRYLWDGTVACQGISPFQYRPASVLAAIDSPSRDTELNRLASLVESNTGIRETLERVHYADLPTVYPSTSQAVFALAYATTPTDASVDLRAFVLKLWLLIFDLGTIALLIVCLRLLGKPVAWCILYAWCPLVLKEITNSGHLDIIAVFFTTLALTSLVHLGKSSNKTPAIKWAPSATAWGMLTCVSLSLAVGAKLYPIVLTPLFVGVLWKQQGLRRACVGGTLVVGLSFLLLYPMLPGGSSKEVPTPPTPNVVASTPSATEVEGLIELGPPPDLSLAAEPQKSDPSEGMAAFLTRWEMNDFIFMVIVENIRPTNSTTDSTPWFVLVPNSFRTTLTDSISVLVNRGPTEAAFLAARGLTAGVFILVALTLAWKATQRDDPADWLHASFLTVAWFWLLCPTQNPWYWIWVLPMLAFVRNRIWIAFGCIVFVYYTRFWFDAMYSESVVPWTSHQGAEFFDLFAPWVQFAPLLIGLAITAFL